METTNKKPQKVLDKIEKIREICDKYDIIFDNNIPNRYNLIIKDGNNVNKMFIFFTYDDVLNALKMIDLMVGKDV